MRRNHLTPKHCCPLKVWKAANEEVSKLKKLKEMLENRENKQAIFLLKKVTENATSNSLLKADLVGAAYLNIIKCV